MALAGRSCSGVWDDGFGGHFGSYHCDRVRCRLLYSDLGRYHGGRHGTQEYLRESEGVQNKTSEVTDILPLSFRPRRALS